MDSGRRSFSSSHRSVSVPVSARTRVLLPWVDVAGGGD